MASRTKAILRCGGITLAFAIYSIALMIPVLDFGLTSKYNGPPSRGEMEARLCEAIINNLSRSVDTSCW
jgi:hypothetical protein